MKVLIDQKAALEKGVMTGIYNGFFESVKRTGLGNATVHEDFPVKGAQVLEVAIRHAKQIVDELGIKEG